VRGTACAAVRRRRSPEIPAALARVDGPRMKSIGGRCQRSAVLGLLGDPAALDVASQLRRMPAPSDREAGAIPADAGHCPGA
jgi:hypothetical protein